MVIFSGDYLFWHIALPWESALSQKSYIGEDYTSCRRYMKWPLPSRKPGRGSTTNLASPSMPCNTCYLRECSKGS